MTGFMFSYSANVFLQTTSCEKCIDLCQPAFPI